MAVRIYLDSSLKTLPLEQLPAAIETIFQQLEDQINSSLEAATRYRGDTISETAASMIEYPSSGDWGFHTDTTAGTYKLAKNKGGIIYLSPALT